jgi:hypothetical protein
VKIRTLGTDLTECLPKTYTEAEAAGDAIDLQHHPPSLEMIGSHMGKCTTFFVRIFFTMMA